MLLLRTCHSSGRSFSADAGGYVWDLTLGAVNKPVEFDPSPVCGNGLHGLAWGGQSSSDLLHVNDPEAVGVVFETPDELVVSLDNDTKSKVPIATVRFVGSLREAATFLAQQTGRTVHFATATAGNDGTATAGHDGTATAGDRGTATAGNAGTATAGNDGTATAGYAGTATAGDRGTIQIKYWDAKEQRYRIAIGYVGENGIEAGKKYRLSATNEFEVAA